MKLPDILREIYCRILLDLVHHFAKGCLINKSMSKIFISRRNFKKAPLGAETSAGTAKMGPGPLSTKKTPSYGYRDPHDEPKTVWWPSQVYNGNPYTAKTVCS